MEHSKLGLSVKKAFGLAFDIQKSEKRTKSGFEPAVFDLGAGKELFGDIRLDGFAAMLRIGFAEHLVVIGGDEGRYKNELPVINRAWAIREMLVHDFEIAPDRVLSFSSKSNTDGNIAIIKAVMAEFVVEETANFGVISNLYHLPRARLDLDAGGLILSTYAAEAFWLLEQDDRKDLLVERFGGGPLAERIAEEVQGIADKIRGSYVPRTDVQAVQILTSSKVQI